MTTIQNLTVDQLRQAVAIREKIEQLQSDLIAIAGLGNGTAPKLGLRKRHMSASAKAKIAAAQRARWAKLKGKKSAAAPKRKRRKMSPAAKARLAAIAKARWAKVKAAGKSSL